MAEEEDGTVTDITAKLAEALREALSVATTHRVAALDAIHGARGQTTHVISDGEWYAFEDLARAALSALPARDDETVERVARALYPLFGGIVTGRFPPSSYDDTLEENREAARELARAALSALPSDDGWMPIETAPKDGRWVLVTWEGSPHRCEAMRYEAGDWYWYEGDCTNAPPTHWRPLPPAPAQEPRS